MQSPRFVTFALLTSSITLACAIEPTNEEGVDAVGQAILNGTPVTTEDIGLVKIVTATGGGCSGTLLTPEWVLTAHQCLPLDVRDWIDLHVHSQCDDGIQSGAETGIDCGGSCAACPAPATLALTSQWDTGWCAEVVVTNHTGSPTNSWTVAFDVNDSAVYAQWSAVERSGAQWSADFTNTGSLYTATSLLWNGRIPAAQAVAFGLCANKTGPNWQPELVSAEVH